MPDPIEEFDQVLAQFQSRRFWGDVLAACAFFLLFVCLAGRLLGLSADAGPVLLQLGLLTGLAGLRLS